MKRKNVRRRILGMVCAGSLILGCSARSLAATEQYIGSIGGFADTAGTESTAQTVQTEQADQNGGILSPGWYQISYDYDEGIAVRTGPSAKEELLGRVPTGTMFYVDEVSDVWGHTTAGEFTGWVNLDYASAVNAPSVQKEIGWYRIISDYDAGIAVRTGPSAKEELLGRIPQGTPFYVDATCDVWGHTTVNGYTGWVHLDYAEEI